MPDEKPEKQSPLIQIKDLFGIEAPGSEAVKHVFGTIKKFAGPWLRRREGKTTIDIAREVGDEPACRDSNPTAPISPSVAVDAAARCGRFDGHGAPPRRIRPQVDLVNCDVELDGLVILF